MAKVARSPRSVRPNLSVNGYADVLGMTALREKALRIMFVKDSRTGTLVKISTPEALFDPIQSQVQGQQQAGEEEQPVTSYEKTQLLFPSGESLPKCWTDPNYQM